MLSISTCLLIMHELENTKINVENNEIMFVLKYVQWLILD